MERMKQETAWLTGKQQIEIKEECYDGPGAEDVVVRIEEVGICGSDAAFFESGMIGPDELPFPLVLGHECAGTVVETGSRVTKVKIGDRVCLEPGIPCGKCEYCMSGRYNLCPDVDFMAAPPDFHGCLKRYVRHPEKFTFKLPDNVSTRAGAMVEPLSVGYHAAQRGNAGYGKSIVILGAGCIGLMTLMSCKIFGAQDITVVDLYENRLEMAQSLGASAVIDASAADTVTEYLGGHSLGADIVFETAGSIPTTKQAGKLVKPGGTIVLVGNTHGDVPFDFFEIMNKEVDVKCVFRYNNSYPPVIDAVAKGLADPLAVITNEFSFEEVQTAFASTISDKKNIIKSVIHFDTAGREAAGEVE